ncbi:MAG: hypothetical protein O3A01_08440 [bacterium]|nr:hypothetical protein [bacterium]
MKPRILIIAGEMSSDKYGAALVPEIRAQYLGVHITAIGGLELKTLADTFIEDIASTNSVGIFEQLGRWAVRRAIKQLKKTLLSTSFSSAIIIDCAHINTKFGPLISAHNIPVVSYITPNFWMWNDQKNMAILAAYSHTIIAVSPAERDAFKPIHNNVKYFGHPLVENLVKSSPETSAESVSAITRNPQLIAGYIGSRKQEVNNLLPTFGKVAEILKTIHDIDLVLAPLPPHLMPYTKSRLKKWPYLKEWAHTNENLLNTATMALAGAGTTTLELTKKGLPQVVVGRIHPLSAFIGRFFIPQGLNHIALPNILSGRAIVPEFIQSLNPHDIATELVKLIQNTEALSTIKSNYEALIKELTPNSASLVPQVVSELVVINNP